MQPSKGLSGAVLLTFDNGRVGVERFRHRGAHENLVGIGQVAHRVDIRGAEDICHSIQDGMGHLPLQQHATRPLNFVLAVVSDPSLSQDFQTKVVIRQPAKVAIAFERVGGGPQAYDGLARIQKACDVLGGLSIRIAKTRADDH